MSVDTKKEIREQISKIPNRKVDNSPGLPTTEVTTINFSLINKDLDLNNRSTVVNFTSLTLLFLVNSPIAQVLTHSSSTAIPDNSQGCRHPDSPYKSRPRQTRQVRRRQIANNHQQAAEDEEKTRKSKGLLTVPFFSCTMTEVAVCISTSTASKSGALQQ